MSEYRFYKLFYNILAPLYRLTHFVSIKGSEKVPEGAAIVCANHSHALDFLLMAMAVKKKNFLHFMAKSELLKDPVLRWAINKAGSFCVNRASSDLAAVRTSMRYLKSGEKIGIFPEGTRVDSADAVEAKRGAVVLAARCKVPIVPVYIPRKKKLFQRVSIVVGDPYMIEAAPRGASEEYNIASQELMRRIEALGENNA